MQRNGNRPDEKFGRFIRHDLALGNYRYFNSLIYIRLIFKCFLISQLPLLDDMVDTLMSRDSDSAITSREKEAVSDWLASNKSFHIMRDHPAHCFFGFIMGCKLHFKQ